MSKLTQPQVKALQYFAAIADGCPSKRMRERGLKHPVEPVIHRLFAMGLLTHVSTTRYDYLLKCDVPDRVLRLSPEGLAALGVDQPF